MAYTKVAASLLVALISSLISCVQINAAVINLHNHYIRDGQDVLRLLSMNSGHHKVKKKSEPLPKAILDATRKDMRMVGQKISGCNRIRVDG